MDALGPALNGWPSVRRIVASPHDERADARSGKPLQAFEKTELRRNRPIAPIADTARQKQEGRVLIDGQLDQRVPGLQRRLPERMRECGGACRSPWNGASRCRSAA
jgi:hypothetical protein